MKGVRVNFFRPGKVIVPKTVYSRSDFNFCPLCGKRTASGVVCFECKEKDNQTKED